MSGASSEDGDRMTSGEKRAWVALLDWLCRKPPGRGQQMPRNAPTPPRNLLSPPPPKAMAEARYESIGMLGTVRLILCRDCGSAVALTETHDRWHEDSDRPKETSHA